MYKLNLLFLLIFLSTTLFSESPHGKGFKYNCSECHNTESWNVINYKGSFDHNKTRFPLIGQHKIIGCRFCHPTLEFSKSKKECSECHQDIHQGTVGKDCNRCHTPKSWIVMNVKQLHAQIGFTLQGSHASADCSRCHSSSSQLYFYNIRTDCYACHKAKYVATTNPNHISVGFDTNCGNCHNMTGQNWSANGKGFIHSIFPLTGAHNIDCILCHKTGEYKTKLSTDCKICHSVQYSQAKSKIPAHATKYINYACSDCHSPLSWSSGIRFSQHDSWFGIYSGRHRGAWNKCTDCHNNDATYKANCKKCHD